VKVDGRDTYPLRSFVLAFLVHIESKDHHQRTAKIDESTDKQLIDHVEYHANSRDADAKTQEKVEPQHVLPRVKRRKFVYPAIQNSCGMRYYFLEVIRFHCCG
jgi:hypothetical protein